MSYQTWTRRWGDVIRDDGPRRAALLAGVPAEYGDRYRREAEQRRAIAGRMGAPSEFYIPIGTEGR